MSSHMVMHVITGLDKGGAEAMLLKLIRSSNDRLFTPVVVSLRSDGALESSFRDAGVAVHTLGMARSVLSFLHLLKLVVLIRRIKPDLIMGWMYHGNIASWLCRTLSGLRIPLLWNVRHTPGKLSQQKPLTAAMIRLGALVSKQLAQIVYNSNISLLRHVELGFSEHNSIVIPNGFDINVFKPSSMKRGRMREKFGVSEQDLVVGHVARFHPMKDHKGFLLTAKMILDEFNCAKFVLVGRDVCLDNSFFSELINKYKLWNHVQLLGERFDVSDLLQAFDVLCLSSEWGEGFPNILGEAMASGVPCVTTDVGDAGSIVGDKGKVVEAGDPEALTKACCDLLSLTFSERQKLGGLARRHIVDKYSMPSISERYESLYEGVIEGHGLSKVS